MPLLDNEHLGVARVWSDALLALAAERGEEDALLAELRELVALLDRQSDVEEFLANPSIADEAKRALLEKALRGRASDLLVDALQVLRRKGRLEIVRALAHTYHQGWLELRGRVEVKVVTAAPLSQALRAELQEAVNRRTGKIAEITATVDPDLLGGMVMRVGDQRFDSSLRAQLDKIQRLLLVRASNELLSGREYTRD